MDYEEAKELFKMFAWIMLVVGVVTLVGGLFANYVRCTMIEGYQIHAYVNSKLVYNGKKAGVKVSSAGANTRLTIYKKPFYIIPQKYYVSKDIIINSVGECNI